MTAVVPTKYDDAALDELWQQRWAALYKARVQCRYHKKREAFFDLFEKAIAFATIVMGLSLAGKSLTEHAPLIGLLVSALAAFALVFGFAAKKNEHKVLAELTSKLAAEIARVPQAGLNFELTASWQAELDRLVGVSPAPLPTLAMLCEREQSIADGFPNHVMQPSRHARLFKHFW